MTELGLDASMDTVQHGLLYKVGQVEEEKQSLALQLSDQRDQLASQARELEDHVTQVQIERATSCKIQVEVAQCQVQLVQYQKQLDHVTNERNELQKERPMMLGYIRVRTNSRVIYNQPTKAPHKTPQLGISTTTRAGENPATTVRRRN